jgi:23S rRNA pseudouridine2605 synthase
MPERRPPRKPTGPARRPGPPRKPAAGPAGPRSASGRDRDRDRPREGRQGGDAPGAERLQKVLAHAGIASRRSCEEMILQGRVTVDGQVVRELGTRVDPDRQKVAVDGQAIRPERMVYFAVSKPKGYVSTNSDPSGRPRVVDLLPEIPERVFTVGRLDEMSVGLMILTNDGEMANRLAHPKYGVEKLYRCVVAGHPTPEVLDKLVEGVWLAEGKARARRVKVVGKQGDAAVLEMVLAEGKNREVRRMLAKLGHKVMSLTRVAVGPITLRGLRPGEWRPLSPPEIEDLRRAAAGLPTRTPRGRTERPQRPPSRGPARHAGAGPRPAQGPGMGMGMGPGGPAGSGERPAAPPRVARPAGPGGGPRPGGRPAGPPPSGRPAGPQGGPRPGGRPTGPPPSGRPAGPSGRRADRPAGPRPVGPGPGPVPGMDQPRGRKILGLSGSMREPGPGGPPRRAGGGPKRAGGPPKRAGGPRAGLGGPAGGPRKAPILKRPRRRPPGEGAPPSGE